LGEAILVNSRPFEGLIFSMPVFAILLTAMFVREAPSWQRLLARFVLPFAAVMILCFSFLAYYNWPGTGDALLFPYTVNDRAYESGSPALLWQQNTPPLHYQNPQFESFYNVWEHSAWVYGRARSVKRASRLFARHLEDYTRFFLGPELCLPFLALPWIWGDRRVLFFTIQMVVCLAGFVLVAWFGPHYAGPTLVTLFALLVMTLRCVREWTYRGYRVGVGISRAVVLAAVVLAPFHPHPFPDLHPNGAARERVAEQLSNIPGRHLVVVHYSPQHYVHDEWVYNRAQINDAKIVWARDIPGVPLLPLLNYFSGYRVWVVNADDPTPKPQPYTEAAPADSAH
jgi:hypothetical protein